MFNTDPVDVRAGFVGYAVGLYPYTYSHVTGTVESATTCTFRQTIRFLIRSEEINLDFVAYYQ